MSSPFFSVIVPVYNVEKYLHQCVDSILSQSFSNFEVILVDDGSPDNSPSICDEYAKKDTRVKVIHKPNGGVSSARNRGLLAATGEYVVFVDSDDLLIDKALAQIHAELQNVRYDILNYGFIKQIEPNGATVNVVFPEREHTNINETDLVNVAFAAMIGDKKQFLIEVCSQAFKRKLLVNHHIQFDEKLYKAEDQLFTLRAYVHAQTIKIIPSALYFYRFNDDSCMNSFQYSEHSINNSVLFLKRIREVLTECAVSEELYSGYYYKSLVRVAIFPCLEYAKNGRKRGHDSRAYFKQVLTWYFDALKQVGIELEYNGSILTKFEIAIILCKSHLLISLYLKLLMIYEKAKSPK